jgi:hypothetical protein
MLHDLIGATGTVGANQHLAAPLPAAVGNDNCRNASAMTVMWSEAVLLPVLPEATPTPGVSGTRLAVDDEVAERVATQSPFVRRCRLPFLKARSPAWRRGR